VAHYFQDKVGFSRGCAHQIHLPQELTLHRAGEEPRWCPGGDLNPHNRFRSADFKSAASADFATRACTKASVLDERLA
jgi:hypothetical protein